MKPNRTSFGNTKVKGFCIFLIGLLVCIFVFILIVKYIHNVNASGVGKGTYYSEKCWVPKGRDSCAPQFIIAGAMKCGTTSLWSYLLQHPNVLPLVKHVIDPKGLRDVLAEKEVRFFNDPGYSQLTKAYGKGKATGYYLDLFDPSIKPTFDMQEIEKNITGEATPMYINSIGTVDRILSTLPYVKLMIILRNPIDRAYSDYWFHKTLKTGSQLTSDPKSTTGYTHDELFEQCMNIELDIIKFCKLDQWADNPNHDSIFPITQCLRSTSKLVYTPTDQASSCKKSELKHICLSEAQKIYCPHMILVNSVYAFQILEWYLKVPKGNLLILRSEDLFDEPTAVMSEVSSFLNIRDIDWTSITNKTFNIVNPKTLAGSKTEIITNTETKKNLQIGSSDSASDYPALSPVIRKHLLAKMASFNDGLARLVGDSKFMKWNF